MRTSPPIRRSRSASGRHEFDGQLGDWTPEGIQKEIARLEQARQRAVGFQDGDAVARGALPARLRDQPHRRRSVLAARCARAVHESQLVLQRRARSEHVRHRAVRAGRSAAARVHQVRAADPGRGGADQEEPADAAAEDVHRFRQQEFRRLRRFLSQGRAAGVRGSAGRGAEEAARGGHRAGREGDAGLRQVARRAEARQEPTRTCSGRSASPRWCA